MGKRKNRRKKRKKISKKILIEILMVKRKKLIFWIVPENRFTKKHQKIKRKNVGDELPKTMTHPVLTLIHFHEFKLINNCQKTLKTALIFKIQHDTLKFR